MWTLNQLGLGAIASNQKNLTLKNRDKLKIQSKETCSHVYYKVESTEPKSYLFNDISANIPDKVTVKK